MLCMMNEHLLQIPANSQIFVLTGAGISKESGIQTFRDSDGLWNNHRIEDVASPEGFYRNPSLVYDFNNNRRKAARSLGMSERTLYRKIEEFGIEPKIKKSK